VLVLVDLAGRSLWSSCCLRDVDNAVPINGHLGDVRLVGNGVESGGTSPLVRGPEGARGAVRKPPQGFREFGNR